MRAHGGGNTQTSLTSGDEKLLSDARELLERERTGLTATWWVHLNAPGVSWSPEMFEIYGVDRATVPTREGMRAAIHREDRDRVVNGFRAWEADPRVNYDRTFRIVRPDGGQRLLEMRAWIIDPADQCDRRAIGTVIDLTDAGRLATERRRADEQRQLVLRVSGDGICGLGRDGRVLFFNPAFCALVRRSPHEVHNAYLHDLVHRDIDGTGLHPPTECSYSPDRAGQGRQVDADFTAGDGVRLEVSYVRAPIDEDESLSAVISLRDETEQRAASRRLRASLEHVRALSLQRGALLRQLAGAEERERLRIAADIHDDSVQTLRAVELTLERRRDQIDDPGLGGILEEARSDVHAAATRLRGLMLELLPPVPEVPLVGAIAAYCESQFAQTGFTHEVHGETEELEADTYLLAYRLAQEAIRNARKHSRGSHVSVGVGTSNGRLVLEVTDDGVGIGDVGAHGARGGLRIIGQRIAASGGDSRIGPGPDGRGTTMRIELPLDEDWGT